MSTRVSQVDTFGWDDFVDRFWDRAPVHYRVAAIPAFEIDEVFRAAVLACHAGPDHATPPGVRWGTRDRQPWHAGDLLPRTDDNGFDGYGARVTSRIAGDTYSLVIHGMHGFDRPMWTRQRAFYAGLWDRVGLPSTGAITTLFHGTYESSPVGVHKDRFATFMYVLSGRKRMRLWPRRPWSHDATTVTDYREQLAESLVIDAAAGDLAYWPSSYYHVGENLGDEPATSINVGVPRETHRLGYDLAELVANMTQAGLMDPSGQLTAALEPVAAGPFATVRGTEVSLPRAAAEARRNATAVLARQQGADRRTEVALMRLTAGGFLPAPPPLPELSLPADARLHRTPDSRIMWSSTETGTVVAAEGRAGGTALTAAQLATVVSALSQAQPVDSVLATAGENATEACRDLLVRLIRWHAVALDP
jgi:50S ribosomal protein L16 3-hydroxylase